MLGRLAYRVITVEEFRAEVRDWLAGNLVGDFAALPRVSEAPDASMKPSRSAETGIAACPLPG